MHFQSRIRNANTHSRSAVGLFTILFLSAVSRDPAFAQSWIENQCEPAGNSCQTVQDLACFNIHKDLSVSGTGGGTISFYNDGFQLLGFGLHTLGLPVDQKGTAIGVRGETEVVPIGQPQEGSALGDLALSSGFFAQGHFEGARGFSNPVTLSNFDNTKTTTATGGFFRSDGGGSLQLNGVGTYWIAGAYGEIRGRIDGDAGLGEVAALIGIDNTDPLSTAPHYAGFFDGQMRITDLPLDNALDEIVVADSMGVLHVRDANTLSGSDLDWDISNSAPHMFSLVSGNVGIGTQNPTEKLQIVGTTSFNGVAFLEGGQRLQARTFGGARILGSQGHTPAQPAIGFFSTNGVDDGGGGNGIYRPLANTMAFATGSQERMRITSGGNIGIGNVIPTHRLDVNGQARVRALPLNNSLNNIVVSDANGVLQTRDASTLAAADSDWQVVGTNLHSLPSGNVGIGTTSPAGKVQVIQNAPAVGNNDQFAMKVQTSSAMGGGQRIGLEIQNIGPVGGPRDDVGLWVRTVNGSPDSHENMAAVLNGNVAIGHLSVGNQEIGTQGRYVLAIKQGVRPITTPSAYKAIQLWVEKGQLQVMDVFHNITTLSPHNFSMIEPSEPMAWSFYSENLELSQKISVDMLRLSRVVERISGETLVFTQDLDDDTVHKNDNVAPGAGDIFALREELQQANDRLLLLEQQIASMQALLMDTAVQ